MIKEFIAAWDAERKPVEASIRANGVPDTYTDVVGIVIEALAKHKPKDHGLDDPPWPDPHRIHEIDDGDYQGTRLYLIAADDYQPGDYWFVRVRYGSCSGCDTLEAIKSDYGWWFGDDEPRPPMSDQVATDLMTLCLHIVQGLKRLPD